MKKNKDFKLVITILMVCIIFLSYKTYILNNELNEKRYYENFIVSENFEGKLLEKEYFQELNINDFSKKRLVFVVDKKICSMCFTDALKNAGKFIDNLQIYFILAKHNDPILSNIVSDPNYEKFRLVFSKNLNKKFIKNASNGLIFIEHKGEILLAEDLSKINKKRVKLFFNKLGLLNNNV